MDGKPALAIKGRAVIEFRKFSGFSDYTGTTIR